MPAKQLDFGLTPEEIELQRKSAELQDLEVILAERELELATLLADLNRFENRYLREVGHRLRRLDELEAELAEIRAKRTPDDFILKIEARRARTKAEESAHEVGEESPDGNSLDAPFVPSNDLKSLYRELAKKVHPDLGATAKDGERRTRAMAEVNAAYSAGDEAKLRSLYAEWQQSPEAIEGEGAGAELVRAIRKIAQVQRRLSEIEKALREARESDIFRLYAESQSAKTDRAADLVAEMARELDSRLESTGRQIAAERVSAYPHRKKARGA